MTVLIKPKFEKNHKPFFSKHSNGLFLLVVYCFIILFSDALLASSSFIRVRLMDSVKKINISGYGIYFQKQTDFYQNISIPFRSESYIVEPVLLKNNSWGFKIQSSSNNRTLNSSLPDNSLKSDRYFYTKYLWIKGQSLSVAGKIVYPSLLLQVQNQGLIQAVSVLPIDLYVSTVLLNEVPMSWPDEFLKSQAIAIRSYTLSVIKQRQNKFYQLESSVKDQVFDYEKTIHQKNWNKALLISESTKNWILKNKNSTETLKAFYHADCGGSLATEKNVWGTNENASATGKTLGCPMNPKSKWNYQISSLELIQKIKEYWKNKNIQFYQSVSNYDLLDIENTTNDKKIKFPDAESTNNGITNSDKKISRINDMVLVFKSSKNWLPAFQINLKSNEFRSMLGFFDFRSTNFIWKKINDKYYFSGVGFGHGVGLCQWGASQMAKQGQSFSNILSHYYPQAQLVLNSPEMNESDFDSKSQKFTTTRTAKIKTTDITNM